MYYERSNTGDEMNVYGYIKYDGNEQLFNQLKQRIQGLGIMKEHLIVQEQRESSWLSIDQQLIPCQLGDLLVICSLDSLGSNFCEIHQNWNYLVYELGLEIKVMDMPSFDTRQLKQVSDRIQFMELIDQILIYGSKKEQETQIKKQLSNMVNLKKLEKKPGRKTIPYPVGWEEIYLEWQQGKITAKVAMEQADLKYATFYNLVRRYEKEYQIYRKRIHGKEISK